MKCCDMTAGKLKTPISFQRATKASDGSGGQTVQWDTFASTRCYFRSVSGMERVHSERLEATTRNRAVIRYRSDLSEGDRAIVRDRAYQIRFIDNIEMRDKWLQIDLDGGVAT